MSDCDPSERRLTTSVSRSRRGRAEEGGDPRGGPASSLISGESPD